MYFSYNPWGNIDWIIDKLTHIEKWNFLGVVSTEERSLGAWMWLKDKGKLNNFEMWKIKDVDNPPSPFKEFTEKEYLKNEKNYFRNGGQKLLEFALLESDGNASEFFNLFIKKTEGDLILDISAMPKRWFFPIIRNCIENPKIKNLLVTYTIAKFYSKKQGEESQAWKYFPSFGELPEREKIEKIYIISAGYQPLSLPEWISQYESSKKYILFPFPASITGYTRIWDFIRKLEADCFNYNNNFKIIYVSGFNLPLIYSTIKNIIELEKDKEPIFIPYGPKPVSLAFAIISSMKHFPVGYTQPWYYNPYYSIGFEETHKKAPKTMTYLLKENGNLLYLPPEITYS